MIMMYGWKWWGSFTLLLALAGCAVQPPAPPAPEPEPAPPPRRQPQAPVSVPAPVTLPRVAVVVSMDIPAYNDVAERLQQILGPRATRYALGAGTRAELERSAPEQIVAIGLEAALLARPLAGEHRTVVFCQVFNHMEHDLISPRSHGVGLLPSYRETFAVWKGLAPTLHRVAVFTGAGLDDMLRPAIAEAERQGISLEHHSVSSDKEFLYQYKRLGAQVDGLWLLPDNRILSRNAIQDAMSFSLRNGKQVAVFSEQLLSIGGLFSVTSNPDEIAAKVASRLAEATAPGAADAPGLVFLEQAVVRINPVIAQRFHLPVPESLRAHVSE
jgi:hypothetical protein